MYYMAGPWTNQHCTVLLENALHTSQDVRARDYVWHGTTTRFATLDIATGQVMAQCRKRHRHEEFLAFLRQINRQVPAVLDVHLVPDNYATHKHAKVQRWLAARQRYHMHFTPTYSSWPNQVECWFGLLSQRGIKRSSFSQRPGSGEQNRGVHRALQCVCEAVRLGRHGRSIIDKVERIAMRISGTAR